MSTVEWAAAIAAGGAVLGAAAGGFVTYKVTDRQIRSAEAVAARQRSHELLLAREEREQTRKMDAYQILAGHTIWIEKRALWRLGMLGIGRVVSEPVEPDSDVFEIAKGALILTDEVGSMLVDLEATMNSFSTYADDVVRQDGNLQPTEIQHLKELAQAVHHSCWKLRRVLRSELNLHTQDG